jgi:hypothetical protein
MGIKPILFSAPMVRALLDGTKTQTRRVIKPQPSGYQGNPNPPRGQSWVDKSRDAPYLALHDDQQHWCWWDEYNRQGPDWFKLRISKGDVLWVRETWTARMTHGWTIADARSRMYREEILYKADGNSALDGWWPSIHMPREFSRIALKVAGVKVQRLQDISQEDALAEGAYVAPRSGRVADSYAAMTISGDWFGSGRSWYADLWDRINGPGAWDANPYVAAYTFTVHRGNVDALNGAAA